MTFKRSRDNYPTESIENFRALMKSDFWRYLPENTRTEIINILTEERKLPVETAGEVDAADSGRQPACCRYVSHSGEGQEQRVYAKSHISL